MNLKTTLLGICYEFISIREVLAKANEEKSGDILAGISAKSTKERIAAKQVLSQICLGDLYEHPITDYEKDEVTRMMIDDIDQEVYLEIKSWTTQKLREWLLDYSTTEQDIKRISKGLTAEMIAAVTKLMSNMDLVYCTNKIRVEASCNTTIGGRGILASRLQPNHITDDLEGITASVLEGLSYGVGDALIGLNPSGNTAASLSEILKRFDEIKVRHEIPTQTCVLGHITTQMQAIKMGAKTDLLFQSIAGSQLGNEAFGISDAMVQEGYDLMKEKGTATGPNVMYFETGQGSELSSNAHFGGDQLTMEARCYSFARHYHPFLVNTVVGFIGPEYLYDGKQVIRAGLEDHFMGKLAGLPMGCDCCYTNHMPADQNDLENLTLLLANAGCNFFMGVPAGDDIMLNYQTNSYHDIATVRETLNLRPIPEFERWLNKMGVMENGRLTKKAGHADLFGKVQKGATPARIGVDKVGPRLKTDTLLNFRADHAAARDTVLGDVQVEFLQEMGLKTYQTTCQSKEEYLRRPDKGRCFSEETLEQIKKDCKQEIDVQVYVADGLSSRAIEANIANTLPAINSRLEEVELKIGTPFFVKYGRVATEDAICETLKAEVVCVLIGERPGLYSDESMSAYIVYRAKVGMLETRRTVVSGIHKNGFPSVEAGAYIADLIIEILEKKASGTELQR